MKNIKLLLPLLLIITACSTKEQFRVEGKIENAKDKKLYFEKLGLSTSYPIDSVKLKKDGEFIFKGDKLNQPTFFLLRLKDDGIITLLIDSTETLRITADSKDFATGYKVQNSIGSAYIQILNEKLLRLKNTVNAYLKEYNSIDKSDTKKRQELLNKINAAIKEHKDFIGDFVMEHPRSFASYYALFQRWDDNTMVMDVKNSKDQIYFATVATSLNLLYPESERVKQLYNYVLKAKAEQKKEEQWSKVIKNAKVNSFPDIAERDVNGNIVRLSSLKGKVIILSFWASWDKASVKANRSLKSIYTKYHNKGLEIYQVSLDRSKVLWENEIRKEGLPWINVTDLRYTESVPAKTYNVTRIPANFIISKKGELVGKDLYGQRLDEKIKELLKQK